MDDASRRLAQLARILNDTRPYGEASPPDPVEHLHRVRLQRIQGLTAHLDDRTGRDVDKTDGVAMRLLLDEYAGVLAQLRAVVREGAKTLDGVATVLRTDRRLVDHQLEEQEKRLDSTAPSDRPPASQNPDR